MSLRVRRAHGDFGPATNLQPEAVGTRLVAGQDAALLALENCWSSPKSMHGTEMCAPTVDHEREQQGDEPATQAPS